MKTRINYGINRRNPKTGRIQHQNAKAEIKGAFADPGFHAAVLEHVRVTHRGWSLTGYAEPPKPQEMFILTVEGPVPTRIVVGCVDLANDLFERLTRHAPTSISKGLAPERSAEEVDRAERLVEALMS